MSRQGGPCDDGRRVTKGDVMVGAEIREIFEVKMLNLLISLWAVPQMSFCHLVYFLVVFFSTWSIWLDCGCMLQDLKSLIYLFGLHASGCEISELFARWRSLTCVQAAKPLIFLSVYIPGHKPSDLSVFPYMWGLIRFHVRCAGFGGV